MENTGDCPFEATHSQVSSESSSTRTKPHEDKSSTTTNSTSHPQSLPTMVQETPELSRLEQLPPELRLSILATLDLDQLKNLIKACPTFYQQYQHDRKFILGSALHTTLGPLAVDAYAVHLTSPAKFDRFHPKDAIPRFLKDYQRLRSSLDFSLLEKGLTGNDLSDLATFYLVVVRPFMKMYKDWAFANIANEFKKSNPAAENPPLSRTEEIRIMRALYRFQLWCNLFGRSESDFDEVRILDMFFGHYEPWEVEEINSVHLFAKDGFRTDLYWNIDVSNDRIFVADGLFYIELESTGSRHEEPGGKEGVKVECIFHRREILPTPSTQLNALYTSLFNTLNPCEYYRDSLLDSVLSKDTQLDRRIHYPSPRDQRERDEEPFLFKGDDPAQPSVAWTQTWRDEYSNLFGAFIPDRIPE
ncbi:uncharacterized protein NECHADRAFT_75869 [Fusarium vanettenii 77-13-4]|uniref:F-box domain-containing protein n=1 Tax=Fusarium vanettenii (strain ATCC MYA-4622 / CBS 123669 / FGSC 9596 / NRRL 45880 / 77-13-4) TaxID=660122 RepID=C7Z5U2_FUSV7|nr:uncharacterized protein NECHADRAFT_75869 [Fusarium vanettenii 77-13-4]EEU40583.1 hypothetical protein NECHADRAFT_75869 [Fusarium vanettenii 77-13-4]